MEFGHARRARPLRPARRGRRAGRARPAAADPVPDPARARRAGARVRAGAAGDPAAAGPRARRLPAAAALLGRVLRLAARPARRTCARSRCSRSGSCSRRRSAVAVVAHAVVDGLPWARRSCSARSSRRPTRSRRPRSRAGSASRARVVTIVEGESLVNDGTALVALPRRRRRRSSRASSASGRPALRFVLQRRRRRRGRPGRRLRRRARPPAPATTRRPRSTISLMTAYFAYLPAEALGVSGVLAAVTAGIYMGWHAPELIDVQTRLQGDRDVGDPRLRRERGAVRARRAPAAAACSTALAGLLGGAPSLGAAALVAATVIVTRIVWVFPFTYLPGLARRRRASASRRRRGGRRALVAWIGMRGAVSLAAALALPLDDGRRRAVSRARPDRLPRLRRHPRHARAPGADAAAADPAARRRGRRHRTRRRRRRRGSRRPRRRSRGMEELADEGWVQRRHRRADARPLRVPPRALRGALRRRRRRRDRGAVAGVPAAAARAARGRAAARSSRLRNEGRISDEVMRRVERDLDLEDARLDV